MFFNFIRNHFGSRFLARATFSAGIISHLVTMGEPAQKKARMERTFLFSSESVNDNDKLIDRGVKMIVMETGLDRVAAAALLNTHGSVRKAIDAYNKS